MAKELIEAIKVCRIRKRKLGSVYNDGKITRYKKRFWTNRPKKCGPLAVFSNIHHAERFFNHTEKVVFYSCMIVESEEKALYCEKGSISGMMIPTGTLFADKVKLTEKLREQ